MGEMKRVEIEDLTQIRSPGEVTLSPEGGSVCVTIHTQDRDRDKDCTDQWLIRLSMGEVRRLTHSGNNPDAIWEDEHTLLLQTEREEGTDSDKRGPEKKDSEDKSSDKKDEESSDFYRLPIDGGEAYKAFTIPLEVSEIHRISKGCYAVLADVDWNSGDTPGIHILEEAPAQSDGDGFTSGHRNALYIYREEGNALTRLTERLENVSQIAVKDDRILAIINSPDGVMRVTDSLVCFNVSDGTRRELLPDGQMKLTGCAWTDDGVIFAGSDMEAWGMCQDCDLFRIGSDGEMRLIWEHEGNIVPLDVSIQSDVFRYGRALKTIGSDILFIGQERSGADILSLDAGAGLKHVTSLGGGVVTAFDADSEHMVAVLAMPDGLPAVYHIEDGGPRLIFDPNEEYLRTHTVSKARPLTFTDVCGDEIEGWVIEPVDVSEDAEYPAILAIHGGPRGAYGTPFFHEMQTLAAMGYYVMYCNPRGSSGYGEDFADIRGCYGTVDYDDLMAFVDHVLEQYPRIDRKRLGAMGGSYGGFMCNWIEGHTDRFAAICSMRSISNWISDFGNSELGVTFDPNEMAATPWDGVERMWEMSPLRYADRAVTPILLLHSTGDNNCCIEQGLQMFTAMKYHHVPSRMVVFDGESHSLSRRGTPAHRIRRLTEIRDWFERYLHG